MTNYERHDWLARRIEAPLDANRPIIDPHHHLWERPESTYLAPQLLADTGGAHNVTHTVFVECSAEYDDDQAANMAPVGETRFVAEQASEAERLGGSQLAAIVGHVDLTLGPAVAEVLAAHVEAGNGLFRGIRHGTNWSAHDDVKNGHHGPAQYLLADRMFRDGISALSEMGLSFDAWMYFDQLPELADLARAIPECSIVLDHLGGPLGIGPHATARTEMVAQWRRGLEKVASHENVAIKIGGLGMEHYFGTSWAALDAPPSSEQVAEHWGDMTHFAIDSFGPDRCMFESNFPVDRQTMSYTVLWNAFQILADRYSTTEQDDLFFNTAARVYRIEP